MGATESEGEIEDKEKKKIESFEGKVIVLIPTPPTSNLYILNILAKISEVIHLIKNKDKKNITLQLHFLMLIRVMKEAEDIREPLIEHYKDVIKDVKNNMDTLAEIREHEFQSLVNNFIMSLEGLSDKERREIISNLEYLNIENYIERKGIKKQDALSKFLEGVKESIEKEGKMDKAAFDTFFTSFDGTEKHAMGELLTILFEWDEKGKILIVMDDVRNIIENTDVWQTGIKKKEKVAFANYSNPRKVFGTDSPPPSFSNLLSRHINEGTPFKYEEKKEFFFNMLTRLNSDLFSIKGETKKTLTEEELKEIINDGFLTVQKSIIQQLSTII